MLIQDYLTQTLIRLKPAEEWSREGDGLCFVFQHRGAGKYVSDELMQKLAPGDVLVFSAATPAKLSPVNGTPVAFHYFSACLEHLAALFTSREISQLQNVTDGFKRARFYPHTSPVARECHTLLAQTPPRLTLEHRGQLLRIVAAILSEEFKNARSHRPGGSGPVEDHVVQVMESLSSEEILSLSVDDLAQRFNCTRRHLNRLFHTYFGTSVAALKMEMRLLKAVALLQNPEAKIIDVAVQCGFNHQGLFNTCFKKRFGASPGQWRKHSREPEPPSSLAPQGDRSCQMWNSGLCPWTEGGHVAKPVGSPCLMPKERP